MNEQELRQAMHATMASTTAPPPMNESLVLDAAVRSERRRRARWAGVGSAVAAAAVVALAVVVVATTSGAGGPDAVGTGGGPTSTSRTTTSPTGTEEPSTESSTETSWPNGQTDRTASSGPRFDQGATLLDTLTSMVPAGYGAPGDLTYGDPAYGGDPLRYHQAQYRDTYDGVEVWEYEAQLPVTKGTGVGRLLVEVTTAGSGETGDGCDLPPLWGLEGTCEPRTVGDKKVGVYTGVAGTDFDSWAVYRHEDGTIVAIGQAVEYVGSGKPKLAEPPLSADRMAELATDPQLHLD